MNKFLVIFQTSNENYNSVVERIKTLGAWARLNDTSWIIKSDDKNTVVIRDKIKEVIGDGNRLFVINISESAWASYCIPMEVTNWLKGNG